MQLIYAKVKGASNNDEAQKIISDVADIIGEHAAFRYTAETLSKIILIVVIILE